MPAADGHAVTAQEAIDLLNAQRSANGLPASIVENPDWSSGCRQHLAYLDRNPDQWNSNAHDEEPGAPGFTASGREAAQSSVLDQLNGYAATRGSNPWESAPVHLMQLLAPALSVTGYADTPGGCMWTFPGYQRVGPEPPVLYTYPGDGTTIYPSMRADEEPFTPGEFVGIPRSTSTGPHLYVLPLGQDEGATRGRIVSASLTGPSGPVEVRTVDNTTAGSRGDVGSLMPSGGIVIPVRPLEPNATYAASASFVTGGGATLTRSWQFRTRLPEQSVKLRSRRQRSGRFFVVDYAAEDGGKITVTLLRGRAKLYKQTFPSFAGRNSIKIRAPAKGRYTIKAVLKTTITTRYSATVRVTR